MEKVLSDDELYEQAQQKIAEERAKRSGVTEEAPPEPVATEQEAKTPEATEATPEAIDEPFPGYKDLPESVRAHYDQIRQEREQIEADRKKLQNDFKALRERVAPTQRQLAELQSQLAARQAPQPQPPTKTVIKDWIAKQPEHLRERYEEFPEEAALGFEIASRLVSEQTASMREELQNELRQIRHQSERSVLEREHPDLDNYRLIPTASGVQAATQEGASYWSWIDHQSEEVQRAANSESAAEVSGALSLYKWHRDNPELQQELQHPEFLDYVRRLPRPVQAALDSPRIEDRLYVISAFLASRDQIDPKQAAAVDKLAARRNEQARPSPSARQTPAPVNTAAPDDVDANWDNAQSVLRQWRKQREHRT